MALHADYIYRGKLYRGGERGKSYDIIEGERWKRGKDYQSTAIGSVVEKVISDYIQ